MEPPSPTAIMALATVRMPRKTPVWLMDTTRSNSSRLVASKRRSRSMAALLTRMWTAAVAGDGAVDDLLPSRLGAHVEVEVLGAIKPGGGALAVLVEHVGEHHRGALGDEKSPRLLRPPARAAPVMMAILRPAHWCSPTSRSVDAARWHRTRRWNGSWSCPDRTQRRSLDVRRTRAAVGCLPGGSAIAGRLSVQLRSSRPDHTDGDVRPSSWSQRCRFDHGELDARCTGTRAPASNVFVVAANATAVFAHERRVLLSPCSLPRGTMPVRPPCGRRGWWFAPAQPATSRAAAPRAIPSGMIMRGRSPPRMGSSAPCWSVG